MTFVESFIRDGRLQDIEYRTDAPEEMVCPRVTARDGIPMVYIHKERDADHKGFIPVAEFLQRLARSDPGLAATGYRANGRQTTISFSKADRVRLSPRLQEYLAGLRNSGQVTLRPAFDDEAFRFLDGFMEPNNPQFVYWLPRYKQTLDTVREALSRNAHAELFELIWKSRDNAVSNAGRGRMGHAEADRNRERLTKAIADIALDGNPGNYARLIGRFEEWRSQGELASVPRLLIARAFAAIHPDRYHTTVDAEKQDRIVPWFAEHTGFVAPEGGWATKAAALSAHLARSGVFGDDLERRNMFPWFVFEQMRDASGKVAFRHGHTSRPASGIARRSAESRTIEYRHNVIQDRLVEFLCERHGEDAVGTEHPTGTGGRADALVRRPDGRYELYEIKPAASAADAVRQAIGQLLEYGYRRGGLEPVALHVVSDAPMDEVTLEYLRSLETRFGLKLGYMQVDSRSDEETCHE